MPTDLGILETDAGAPNRADEALAALGQVVPVLPALGDVELTIVVLEGFAVAHVAKGDDDGGGTR